MKQLVEFDISKYDLMIFDWDGTLVDSLGVYQDLDQRFVKEFYGVAKPTTEFHRLAEKIMTAASSNSEDDYYRHLDKLFGDGETPMEVIWENIYKYAHTVQAEIDYKTGAPQLLKNLKHQHGKKMALSTGSRLKDLKFFSGDKAKTSKQLKPLEFFEKIVTADDVEYPKPHPESYLKVIKHFETSPRQALVFEDSALGLQAAKAAGLETVVIFDKYCKNDPELLKNLADYYIEDWHELMRTI